MRYYYSVNFPSHWQDISCMVEENYANDYDENDVLVMAVHHFHTIEEIKENNLNHKKIIIYQLEPLSKNHWWSEEFVVSRIKNADEVWDYDLDNIEILKKYGIEAKFKPFIYTESLKRIQNKEEPDIDVFFYGTPTEHRSKILEIISNYGVFGTDSSSVPRIVTGFNLTKECLDEFISRSKIIIDLQDNNFLKKSFDEFIQKQSRIYYALINNKCIISEKSKKNYYDDLIIEAEKDDLLEKTMYLLNEDRWKNYSNVSERFKQMTENNVIKKKMNKIAIFYHLYQTNNWEELFQEQMNSLIQSGLYDECEFIHVGINGTQELPVIFDKIKVEYNQNKILEANTLQKLWEFSNSNPDYKVLYFHSKGVTYTHNEHYFITTTLWRKYLEYYVIYNWKICIKDLEHYDCVGTEWINESKLFDPDLKDYKFEINPHYSGNFWWANSSYIQKLDLDYIYNEEKGWTRWKSEFWIGTKNPNFKSYHNSGKDCLYDFNYSPDYYATLGKKEEFDEPLLLNKMIEDNLVKMETENKIKLIREIPTAWTDHINFAQWIVNRVDSKVVVDLGVDYAYSTFCFSLPQKGHIYGIDSFGGDEHTGIRNTYEYIIEKKNILKADNITFIKGYFDDIAKTWNKEIDILHIDGFHTYEAVKNDYENWSKFVKDDGVILFHDTLVEDRDFGIKKFFEEIDLPKVNFTCSHGLGVVSKNINLIKEISDTFNLPLKKQFIKPLSLSHKKTKIVMISMFKNEAKGIRRMLESVWRHIDFYVFQDNGSTDGTPDIVKEFFADKNIPGFIYNIEEGWVGFGWNRDHLLQTCLKTDHGCDWIMKMDCDEYLEVDEDFDWSYFYNTNTESFHVTAQNPGCVYYRAWIWNAKLPWKFQHDPAHEVIYLDNEKGENFERVNLPRGLRMVGTNDGESYEVRTKYITDALKLEERLIREETMLTDTYHFWYIAKSYMDCYGGDFYPLKESHSKEFARRFIFYFEEYLKHINAQGIHEMSYFSAFSIGLGHKYLGDYEKAIEWFNAAEKYCPIRNEHIVNLALTYDELKQYDKMLEQTTRLLEPDRKLPFPDYYFLLDTNIYYDSGDYPNYLHNYALSKVSEEKNINSFSINITTKPRLWIVDDFYADPHAVREFALQQEFESNLDYYKGNRTKEQFIIPGTKEAFEKIIGKKITKWTETHGMCGRLQYCTAEDDLVYHCDGQTLAGMVYLTPDAPLSCGTSLYAHKRTGLRNENEFKDINVFDETGYYDKTKFELVDTAGNVFNRLVLFDAKCIHSANEYFGTTKENSRLFHLFFFD